METLPVRWYQQHCKQMSATKLVIYIIVVYTFNLNCSYNLHYKLVQDTFVTIFCYEHYWL